MLKITLYIGLNDKDTKKQEIETIEAFKIVSNLISTLCNGGTIYSAQGIYKHENGEIVIENTLRVELIEIDPAALKRLADTIKQVLNQESIIIQRENIDTEMY